MTSFKPIFVLYVIGLMLIDLSPIKPSIPLLSSSGFASLYVFPKSNEIFF
jgi:hypothetical protein